jgi:hypothetical protein
MNLEDKYLGEVSKDINKSAVKTYLRNAYDDLKKANLAMKQTEYSEKYKDELQGLIDQLYQLKARF